MLEHVELLYRVTFLIKSILVALPTSIEKGGYNSTPVFFF